MNNLSKRFTVAEMTILSGLLEPAVHHLASNATESSILVPSYVFADALTKPYARNSKENPFNLRRTGVTPDDLLYAINDCLVDEVFCKKTGLVTLALDARNNGIESANGLTISGIIIIAHPVPVVFYANPGIYPIVTDEDDEDEDDED
jgi:hypothetical protein